MSRNRVMDENEFNAINSLLNRAQGVAMKQNHEDTIDFVISLVDQFNKRGTLSDKQLIILERVSEGQKFFKGNNSFSKRESSNIPNVASEQVLNVSILSLLNGIKADLSIVKAALVNNNNGNNNGGN